MTFERPAVALMQPTFLPWQGYFALIANADHFVFLDDFQFVRRSFMHRNRLFLAPNNPNWVSLPVEHGGRAALNEVQPILSQGFRDKLLSSIQHAYAKSPYLKVVWPALQDWLGKDWGTLADLNIAFIELAAEWLGYRPKFARSSEIGSEGKRSARLVSILDRLGAKSYLSARGSFSYMVEDAVFPLRHIDTYFQYFQPQAYPQRQAASFVPFLSVLDSLLQVGSEATRDLIAKGQKEFVPWAQMSIAGEQSGQASVEIVDDQSH